MAALGRFALGGAVLADTALTNVDEGISFMDSPLDWTQQKLESMAMVPAMVALNAGTSIVNSVGGLAGFVTGNDDWGNLIDDQAIWDSLDPSMGDIYYRNKGLIETGGFLASMLIGGTGMVKVANAGLRGLSAMSKAERAMGLAVRLGDSVPLVRNMTAMRLPSFTQNTIAKAIDTAMATPMATVGNFPKTRLLLDSIARGAFESTMFEVGGFIASNQNGTYNPEKLDALSAFRANANMHIIGGLGLGTAINSFALYRQSAKVVNNYVSAQNKAVAAGVADTKTQIDELRRVGAPESVVADKAFTDWVNINVNYKGAINAGEGVETAGTNQSFNLLSNSLLEEGRSSVYNMIPGTVDGAAKRLLGDTATEYYAGLARFGADTASPSASMAPLLTNQLAGLQKIKPLEIADTLRVKPLDGAGAPEIIYSTTPVNGAKLSNWTFDKSGYVKIVDNGSVKLLRGLADASPDMQISVIKKVVSETNPDAMFMLQRSQLTPSGNILEDEARAVLADVRRFLIKTDEEYAITAGMATASSRFSRISEQVELGKLGNKAASNRRSAVLSELATSNNPIAREYAKRATQMTQSDLEAAIASGKKLDFATFDSWIEADRSLSQFLDTQVGRLFDPREMLARVADAYAANPKALNSMSATVASLLKNNELLRSSISRNVIAVRNLRSGELFMRGGVHGVLADYGPISYKVGKKGVELKAGAFEATLPAIPRTVQDIEKYGTEEMSGIWHIVSNSPDSILAGLNKIEAGDIVSLSALEQQMLKTGHHKGFGYNSLDEVRNALRDAKDKAFDYLGQKVAAATDKQFWGIDRMQRMLGTSEDYVESVAKGVSPSQVNAATQARYWDTPMHMTEIRTRTLGYEADAAAAVAANQEWARLGSLNSNEAMANIASINPKLYAMFSDLPDYEQAASMAFNVSTDGVASGILFSNAGIHDRVNMLAQTLGERRAAWRTQVQNKVSETLKSKLMQLQAEGKHLDVLAIMHKVQAGRAQGLEYRAIKLASGGDQWFLMTKQAADRVNEVVKRNPNTLQNLETLVGSQAIKIDSGVGEFLELHHAGMMSRKELVNSSYAAAGKSKSPEQWGYYFPPRDLAKQPHVAWVKTVADASNGYKSEMRLVAAADKETLATQVNALEAQLKAEGLATEVRYRNELTETQRTRYGEAFDHSFDFGSNFVDTSMQALGRLQGDKPRFAISQLDDLLDWHVKQHVALFDHAVEAQMSPLLRTLENLDTMWSNTAKSVAGNLNKATEAASPYSKMLSQIRGYAGSAPDAWMRLQSNLDSAVSNGLHALNKVLPGSVQELLYGYGGKTTSAGATLDMANQVIDRYHLKGAYTGVEELLAAATDMPKGVGTNVMRFMNGIMTMFQLSLDAANSMLQLGAAPIRALPALQDLQTALLKGNASELSKYTNLLEVTGVKVSDAMETTLVSPGKAYMSAVANIFSKETKDFVAEALSKGVLKDVDAMFHEIVSDGVSLPKTGFLNAANAWSERARAFGAKWLLGNKAEMWSRLVTAKAAHTILEAAVADGKILAEDVWPQIQGIINKTNGSTIAASRPGMFQGMLGSGATLFQTYQLTMLQQMAKLLEDGGRRELAKLLGLQGAVFGLQGLPFFDLLNDKAAQDNAFKSDLYDKMYTTLGKTTGDFVLYGLGSAPLNLALYNRGDMAPRFATIVPVAPADFPAINMTTKTVGAMWDMAKKLYRDGFHGQILLEGLVNASQNRPVKMLTSQMLGAQINSRGNIVAPMQSDWLSWNTFAHVAGAKTMDEAIISDVMYRSDNYKLQQQEALSSLAGDVKTAVRGDYLDSDMIHSVAERYVKVKGDINSFNSWLYNTTKNASPAALLRISRDLDNQTYRTLTTQLGAARASELHTTLGLQASTAATLGIKSKLGAMQTINDMRHEQMM